jgi:hypothetical protein
MATRAAILRSVARCAILLEHALLKLLGDWVRQQAARLETFRALEFRALGFQASGRRQQRKDRQPRPRERNDYDRIIRHTNQPAR